MTLPDLSACRSALIVKPSSLGDIVHALPAVHALKQAHPHLKLRWVAKTEWLPLLAGSPDLEELIPFPQRDFRGVTGAARLATWAAKLNQAPREVPEVVLDFQGLLRSGLISAARGSRPVIGMSDAREGSRRLHDVSIEIDAGAHAVDRCLGLVQALGVPVKKVVFPLPAGDPVQEMPAGRFVLVHPWSRGEGKSLGAHELQVLCDCLPQWPIVIVGVNKNAPAVRGSKVVNLANKTSLAQLLYLMRRASAVVSVDSGPLHMAAAVNDNTLGLHTWSDPRKVGPYNPEAWVWKAGRIAHRHEFTPDECTTTRMISEGDARRIADFIAR